MLPLSLESVLAVLGPVAGARAWVLGSAPLSFVLGDNGARFMISRDDAGRIVKIEKE